MTKINFLIKHNCHDQTYDLRHDQVFPQLTDQVIDQMLDQSPDQVVDQTMRMLAQKRSHSIWIEADWVLNRFTSPIILRELTMAVKNGLSNDINKKDI